MTQAGDGPADSSAEPAAGSSEDAGGGSAGGPGFWTRRRFLSALGVAGGAGAVVGGMEVLGLFPDAEEHKQAFTPPRESDFHLQGRVNGVSVLILGAGDAGLATAYELEKAGYRTEILEARSRPGGRAWTVRGGTNDTDSEDNEQHATFRDGHYMNAGPARIPQGHTTLDYCRELRVPVEVFVNANPEAYVYRTPAPDARGPLTRRPVRRRAAKADLTGYVNELLAKAIDQNALDTKLGPADQEALISYLQSTGALLPGSNRYAGSANRGYAKVPTAGNDGGSVGRPYDLGDLLASGLGRTFGFEAEWDQAMPMFQPVGGMDQLPRAIAAQLRGTIRYDAPVSKITLTSDGVTVEYSDASGTSHSTSAAYCVCTIPPTVLVDVDANWPSEVTSALGEVMTLPVGKLGLEYGRRFWEDDDRILGGITDTNLDISTIWYPSYGFHSETGGVLIGYYTFADGSMQYAAMTPEDRARRAVEQGVRIHGEAYAKDLLSSFSVHWDLQPFSAGGWALWADRAGSTAYQTLLRPAERLYFAGD
ncbi:MAG TPA: flavin monoamine oxidase family protein, partial [Nocardioidaceae bacterium]